jgi:hypothetical protein
VVSLVLLVIIVVLAAWLRHLAMRGSGPRFGWHVLWRLAFLIGAVRIAALWLGNAASNDPGWPQKVGYFLLMLGLPEIYFVRSTRGDPLTWLLVGSALLAASSLAWAALLLWVANRVGPHGETRR